MDKNEIVQITIVALIILMALLWIVVRLIKKAKNDDAGKCGCCELAKDCNIKQLSERAKKLRKERENCHGGQSAKN